MSEVFRKILASFKISQVECAERLQVTPRSVNQWATGKRKVPGPVWAWIRAYSWGLRMEKLAGLDVRG